MPQNQAAYQTKAGVKALQVADAPYHPPGANEVVLKNHAVAINPVDWKMQDSGIFIESYPTIFGCDVAGTVKAVGRSVTGFKQGDRVIGTAACLTLGPKYASFQSYVPCPEHVMCKIPSQMSFAQGCVLPLAIDTAALALFQDSTLKLPMPSVNPTATGKTVLIYGGSTSVGSCAIQLAKAAGVSVVAVASSANRDYCTSLGADLILDYRHSDWIEEGVAALKDRNLVGAFDTIAGPSTTKMLSDLISRLGLGDIPISSVGSPPEGIKATMVFGTNITLDERLAKAVWSDFLPKALSDGSFIPKPDAKVVGTGLGSLQGALDAQRAGVSAQKVVVEILQA